MAGTTETTAESYFDCEKPHIGRCFSAKHHHRRRQQQPELIRKSVDPWTSFQGVENYLGHKENELRKPVRALLKDQVGLPEFNVAYSLNKKGRWQLPTIMQRDIEAYQDLPNQLRVSLVNANEEKLNSQPEIYQPIKSYHTFLDTEPVHKIAKNGKAKAADFLRPENPPRRRKGRLCKNLQNPADLLDNKNYFNSPLEEELEHWERNAHIVYTTYTVDKKAKSHKLAKGSKKEHHHDWDYEYEIEEDLDDEVDLYTEEPFPVKRYYDLEDMFVNKKEQRRQKKAHKNSNDLYDLCSTSSSEVDQDYVYVFMDKERKPVGHELPLLFESDDELNLVALFGEENMNYCEGVVPATCCVTLTETSAVTLKFITGTTCEVGAGDVAVVVMHEGQMKIYLNKSTPKDTQRCASFPFAKEHILEYVVSPEKLIYPNASYDELQGKDAILDAIFSQHTTKPMHLPRDACLQCGSVSITCFNLRCGHLFCRDCARSHVLTEEDLPISCPFPQCASLYDPATLTSFVPLAFVDEYSEKLVEKRLALPDFLKCYRCKRINHFVNDGLSKDGIAMCPCGEALCRKCEREAHAPLDCQQMEFYEAMLFAKGDTFHTIAPTHGYISEIEAVVCPSCGYPVERSFGCNHMTCWCGCEFCYRCGLGYENGKHQCGEAVPKRTFEITDDEAGKLPKRVMEHCNEIRQKKTFRLHRNFRGSNTISKGPLISIQRQYTHLFDILERAVVEEYLNGSSAKSKYLSSRLEFTLTRVYQIVCDAPKNVVPNFHQIQGLILESIKLCRNFLSLYKA